MLYLTSPMVITSVLQLLAYVGGYIYSFIDIIMVIIASAASSSGKLSYKCDLYLNKCKPNRDTYNFLWIIIVI